MATHEGWQYVVHESPQHAPGAPPDFLHVMLRVRCSCTHGGRSTPRGLKSGPLGGGRLWLRRLGALFGTATCAVAAQPRFPATSCAQSIEFETVARVIGHLGIRMSMIAYPIVAINRVGALSDCKSRWPRRLERRGQPCDG